MFIVPLLFIALIIGIFVFLLRSIHSNPSDNTVINNSLVLNKPLEILNERYAKGEIAEEEYLKIRRNLS